MYFTKFMMRYLLFFLCFYASTSLVSEAGQNGNGKATDPAKFALIIAVGKYAPETGWTPTSAANDVSLIRTALSMQGFDTENHVMVVQDAEADKQGIIDALAQLTAKATEGSVVVIHFSGHGQQVEDVSGDELDGFDEALVPYDAPKKVEGMFNTYRGEKHLLDDELDAITYRLRKKIGSEGDLLLILDACHSGTATRGNNPAGVRGTDIRIVFDETPRSGQTSEVNSWYSGVEDEVAPMVVFSGSGAGELNYEARDQQGRQVGSLSYAFSLALSTADGQASYGGIFDRIRQEMFMRVPHQTPRLEGAASRQLLRGASVLRPVYFTISERLDAQTLRVNGGELAGLTEGSRVVLYEPDVQDTARQQPKGRGKVIRTYLAASDILLDRPLPEQEARNSWVLVEKKSLGETKVYCALDLEEMPLLRQKLRDSFDENTAVTYTAGGAELRVSASPDRQSIRLTTEVGGHLLMEEKILTEADTDRILRLVMEGVFEYGRGKLIRQVDMRDPLLRLDFEIVPVNAAGQALQPARAVPMTDKLLGQQLVLKNGTFFKLKVTNQGEKEAYFALLDIQPDNKVNLLIPYGRRTAEEFRIKPGSTMLLPDMFVIGEPFGRECFRLIATEKPLENLSFIVSRGGTAGASPANHPLEVLFQRDYQSRGGKPVSHAASPANISTLYFTITP
jgi:hypothetical protein